METDEIAALNVAAIGQNKQKIAFILAKKPR